MATTNQKLDHISQLRNAVDTTLAGLNAMRALRREWDALGLGVAITQDDLDAAAEHTGLAVADLANVYSSLDALDAVLAAGHATNLYKAAH